MCPHEVGKMLDELLTVFGIHQFGYMRVPRQVPFEWYYFREVGGGQSSRVEAGSLIKYYGRGPTGSIKWSSGGY